MLGSTESQLLELPVGRLQCHCSVGLLSFIPVSLPPAKGKAVKEMTEEMMLKKTEKNRKRRLAAQRRKERRKVREEGEV